jgi:hypothetical protein
LIISVKMKTTGHNNTPAVRLKSNCSPPNEMEAGGRPSVPSSENILVPIISAMMALVKNKNPKKINRF